MRLAIIAALGALLTTTAGNAQPVVLSLDSNRENRCEKTKSGAMWVLHDPPAPTNGQPGVVIVTLLRSDSSGAPSRNVSYTLSSGQTIELECSQGNLMVSYQIVKQE
jgi:hypothetical protein